MDTPFKTKRNNLEIEIESIKDIDNGVELFARAWKDDKPLGFGKDGTVEIERFRIINPPKLALINGEFVEDQQEALLQSLEHTIKLVGKSGDNIVQGKRGNTTSTFYPAAGANSPVDGYIRYTGDASWATTRDAATGTAADVTDTTGYVGQASDVGATYEITRSIYMFDTSAISTDTISSAIFSLAGTGDANQNADSTTCDVVSATAAATNTLATADYDQLGTTVFSTINVSSFTTTSGTYNDFTLDSNGINNINKTGITQFGTRLGLDTTNSTPTGTNRVLCRTADQATTAADPKLVVEHAAGGGFNVAPTMFQVFEI